MSKRNVVGRVIIAGYEAKADYIGTLKLTYDYHNHCITLEEAGEKKEFSTGKRDEPWLFRGYIINFTGEKHEDMPAEGGGRTPNPFVDFEVLVEVPDSKVTEDKATRAALVIGTKLIPGREIKASHAHYLPGRNQWEVLLMTEGGGQLVLKRVYLNADNGKEAGIGNYVPILPKQTIHMEENDIAQQELARWNFEFVVLGGRPVLLYTDDYGAKREYPLTREGEDIDCGYFGIKVLRIGRAAPETTDRWSVDFQLGPPPPKKSSR
jgi:hypothetical protein